MSKSSNILHIGGRFGRGEGGLKLFGQCPSKGPTHFKKGLSLACYKISHFQCFGRIQSFFLGGTSPILKTFRVGPVKQNTLYHLIDLCNVCLPFRLYCRVTGSFLRKYCKILPVIHAGLSCKEAS